MNQDQWNIINERLNHIQSSVDQTNKDLQADREDLQRFALRLGSLEEQLAQVWKIVNNFPERAKAAMSDAVKPVQKEAQQLKEEIASKRVLLLNKTKKKRFWIF